MEVVEEVMVEDHGFEEDFMGLLEGKMQEIKEGTHWASKGTFSQK